LQHTATTHSNTLHTQKVHTSKQVLEDIIVLDRAIACARYMHAMHTFPVDRAGAIYD